MKVVIVGRDQQLIGPLAERLSRDFQVSLVDNSSAVQALLKKGGIDFLVAEATLLLDHNLGREVRKRCPLVRLIALASNPSLLGMADALSSGLNDYFPRRPEVFEELALSLLAERGRILRWQREFLSEIPGDPVPADE